MVKKVLRAKQPKAPAAIHTFVHWFGGSGAYGADAHPHRTNAGARAHMHRIIRERWAQLTDGRPFPGLAKARDFMNDQDESFEVQSSPLGA